MSEEDMNDEQAQYELLLLQASIRTICPKRTSPFSLASWMPTNPSA